VHCQVDEDIDAVLADGVGDLFVRVSGDVSPAVGQPAKKLSQKLITMLAAIPQQRTGQLDEAQVVT